MLEAVYRIRPLAEYLRTDDPQEPYVPLRHDVDRKIETAPEVAHLEADLGVRSAYYFRRKTFDPYTAAEIEALGHEAGYNRMLPIGGPEEKAIERSREEQSD